MSSAKLKSDLRAPQQSPSNSTIRVYLFGRQPPPIGGVTTHVERLAGWLARAEGISVVSVDIGFAPAMRLVFDCLRSRMEGAILHCQTGSIVGPLLCAALKRLRGGGLRVVYSVHSERWAPMNLNSGRIRSMVAKYCLRQVDLLIADSARIGDDVRPFVRRLEVLSPFLPPLGTLNDAKMHCMLGLPPFDAPAVVFNAYRLVSMPDGSDVYGLDTLLEAYRTLPHPLTLILLIPQLSPRDEARIQNALAAGTAEPRNSKRVHVVSDTRLKGWQVIAKADMFIRPTRTDGDAISVREALYFGVRTIASDCSVRPAGVTTFRTADARDLAAKMSSVLGENPLPRSREFPQAAEPASDFVSLYRSVLGTQSVASRRMSNID